MDKRALALGLGVGLLIGMASTLAYLLPELGTSIRQSASAPKPAPELQKFKVDGFSKDWEGVFLIRDAGKEQGIWAKYGLDPEFISIASSHTAPVIKELVASGVKIGFSTSIYPLEARANGAPIKIVAGWLGEVTSRLYVIGDSPIKAVNDLDGKKIGVFSADHFTHLQVIWLNNKFRIKAESVPLGNTTNLVVALKLGKVDAFISGSGSPLRLVDSGELRILVRFSDLYGKPSVSNTIYATEDIIEQNPELVRRFVKATLETIKYLKDNPSYAIDLYIKTTNAPRNLAEKVVSQLDWQPSGRGSGSDLLRAAANSWQRNKESGAIPPEVNVKIEEAVDIRFLP